MTLGNELTFKIDEAIGFNTDERLFLERALRLLLKALYHEGTFERRALAKRSSEGGNGLQDRRRVLDQIYAGEDASFRLRDGILNFYLNLFESRSNTMGVTRWVKNQYKIWVNRKYLKGWMRERYGLAAFAAHLFHEYLHCLALKHKWRHKGTLVYDWGYLVKDIAEGILDKSGQE